MGCHRASVGSVTMSIVAWAIDLGRLTTITPWLRDSHTFSACPQRTAAVSAPVLETPTTTTRLPLKSSGLSPSLVNLPANRDHNDTPFEGARM